MACIMALRATGGRITHLVDLDQRPPAAVCGHKSRDGLWNMAERDAPHCSRCARMQGRRTREAGSTV